MMIGLQWISGVMFGIEFQWEDDVMVIDVGIFRIIIKYKEDDPILPV